MPPAERIATFDNDGTLWCEQPLHLQVFFAWTALRRWRRSRTLADRQPYKTVLELIAKTIARAPEADRDRDGARRLATGMTARQFNAEAKTWLA